MLSYFERNVDGIIPNEYEWPFSWQYWQSILVQVMPFLKRAQKLMKDTAKTAERVAKSKRDLISTKLRREQAETSGEPERFEIQQSLASNTLSNLSDTEAEVEVINGDGDASVSWSSRNEGLRLRARKRPAVR